MRNHPFMLLLSGLLLGFSPLLAQQTVNLEMCSQWAREHSPLQGQASLLQSSRELQQAMIQTSSLPQFQLSGQASYQSDVFALPFQLPTAEIPEIPKFQYNVSLNIQQKLYDGGQATRASEKAGWEEKIRQHQTEVDLFQLKGLIHGLYFNILLLDKQKEILLAQQTLLEDRMKSVQAGVDNGVLLEGDADAFRIRILQLRQELSQAEQNRATIIGLLENWTGKNDLSQAVFQQPEPAEPKPAYLLSRPEQRLFSTQAARLQVDASYTNLSLKPMVSAFGRVGLGAPNPFNFFETGLSPFYMVGLSLKWQPFDWKNSQRQAQVLDVERQMIQIRQAQFEQKTINEVQQETGKAETLSSLLAQDDEIVGLQQKIVKQADAQLTNGVITSADFLQESNKLTQIQLKRELRRLQVLEAQLKARTIAGGE